MADSRTSTSRWRRWIAHQLSVICSSWALDAIPFMLGLSDEGSNEMRYGIKILLGSASIAIGLTATAVSAKKWNNWSAPANIESLPGSSSSLGTPFVDGCAALSPNALTIVFNSNRTGNFDLYIARRSSSSEGFGTPERLPYPINTSSHEACATFGPGNRLYFASNRHDPAYDLYFAKLGPSGWSEPERLGPNINTPGMLEEAADFYSDDEGREVMIFTRRNLAGTVAKMYYSIEGGPASLIQGGPHSSAADARGSVTNDGLTIFFDSTRSGLGGPDLFYSTRSNTSEQFGTAVHLETLSSPQFDARPFISKDAGLIVFSSSRSGSEPNGVGPTAPDMWFSTRAKATGE